MNTTVKLGKELAFYANKITNVFTTNDYIGNLISEYKSHVENLYDQDFTNHFRKVNVFKELLAKKNFKPVPCDTPLDNLEDARAELTHILENKSAYKNILNILMDDCQGTNDAGKLVYDLLSVLKSSSREFTSTALRYDRHMGYEFSVVQVIHLVYSYGKLTGLVDYYNFEEGKDGQEAND